MVILVSKYDTRARRSAVSKEKTTLAANRFGLQKITPALTTKLYPTIVSEYLCLHLSKKTCRGRATSQIISVRRKRIFLIG